MVLLGAILPGIFYPYIIQCQAWYRKNKSKIRIATKINFQITGGSMAIRQILFYWLAGESLSKGPGRKWYNGNAHTHAATGYCPFKIANQLSGTLMNIAGQ